MQNKSKLLYQGCVSTLIYRAIALLLYNRIKPYRNASATTFRSIRVSCSTFKSQPLPRVSSRHSSRFVIKLFWNGVNTISFGNHACFQGVGSRSGQLGRDSPLKSCDLVIRAHFILCLKDGSSAECRTLHLISPTYHLNKVPRNNCDDDRPGTLP